MNDVDNNNDNNNNNNNNDNILKNFDNNDIYTLKSLIHTNKFISQIVNKFNSYSWKNKYKNVLKLDSLCRQEQQSYYHYEKKNNNNDKAFDSLYVADNHKNNSENIDIKLIYITPHIIFYNIQNGFCTSDIIKMGMSDIMKEICIIPLFIFRSYENKCVEFIVDDDGLYLDSRYITLKSYAHKYSNDNNKFDVHLILEKFQLFIQRVFDIFNKTHFIPYFIHPNRLILQKNCELKLLSPNLLQYIFCPFSTKQKIYHNVFSHHVVLNRCSNDDANNDNYNNDNNDCDFFIEKMMYDTVDLILEFFHSSFVTAILLFKYSITDNSSSSSINTIFRNINMFRYFHKNNKYSGKKSSLKTNEYDFEKEYFFNIFSNQNIIMDNFFADNNNNKINQNNNNNNNNNNNWPSWLTNNKPSCIDNTNICKNVYGFCLSFYCCNDDDENNENITKNNNIRLLIHNYGCYHLLEIMPKILMNALKQANKENNFHIFLQTIILMFEIFIEFLSQLKNSIKIKKTI